MSRVRGSAFLSVALVLGVLFGPGLPATAEPLYRVYQNWTAVVEKDGGRYCTPQGYLFSNRKVPDFQLRVVREGRGNPCRIAFVSPFRFVDLTRRFQVRVDGGPGLRIEGAMVFEDGGNARIFTVTDAPTVKTLLRRIRAGAWIRFDYTDPMGQRTSTVFSLMGASAALDAIGCRGPAR